MEDVVDLALVKDFENDLKYLTDAQLAAEEENTQSKIDSETLWVEAICAEQRLRKARAEK